MSGRDSFVASQRARKLALVKVETLCLKYLPPNATYTWSLPDLLGLGDALPKIDQPSVWDAVSEQALPGLLAIYITLIRRSSPLLQPCSAREAQLQESVRASLSKALGSTSDAKRTLRLVLAICRSQSLCCYAVLMADTAASLSRQPSKRTEDAAAHTLYNLNAVTLLIAKAVKNVLAEADPASRAELLLAVATELTASSLLEHWARLLLTLASCEDSKHALELAASNLKYLCHAWVAVIACMDQDRVHSLLASSPCLTYLVTSQLVALCAALDGGTVYGMPEAPGHALFTAVLALPTTRGCVTPISYVLDFSTDALGVLPEAMKRQLQQQAPDLVAGSTPAALPSRAAAAADTPAAVSTPKTAGLLAAAAGEGQEAKRLTALQQPMGSTTGPAAAAALSPALPHSGPAPRLLLHPTFCLEISLRLPTALCSAFARKAGSALVRQGGGVDAGSHCAQFQLRLAESVSPGVFFRAVNGALRLAGELLRDAPAARLRHRGSRDSGSGSGGGVSAAAAPCAPSSALSPVERWWQGAVAVGGALAVTAEHMDAGKIGPSNVENPSMPFSRYFALLELMTPGELLEPPSEPSESVAAALSAGFLPCLERLLRAALLLNCKWEVAWEDGWNAAWAQMLVFADAAQVAAVIDAAAEGLRMAGAAAVTSSGSKDGGAGDSSRLQRAVGVAARLDGVNALRWLYILSDVPGSKPEETETPSSTCSALGFAPGASCSPILPRLGGSLSLIAARLLPELSRAVLGGLLPACHRGDVGLDVAYFHIGWQLCWAPIMAAALAAESVPIPEAANGSAGGGVVGSDGGGGVSGVVGSDGGGGVGAGGDRKPRVARWRQLLLVELRLPGLLGAALGLLACERGAEEVSGLVPGLRDCLRNALQALAALVPVELARMVAAADRAEAAAAGRGGAASAPLQPSPSSGLLRRALGPGGALEDAEVLAAVEAACAGRGAGAVAGSAGGGAGSGGSPPWTEKLLAIARRLSLQG